MSSLSTVRSTTARIVVSYPPSTFHAPPSPTSRHQPRRNRQNPSVSLCLCGSDQCRCNRSSAAGAAVPSAPRSMIPGSSGSR
jgi:hypothetical protein